MKLHRTTGKPDWLEVKSVQHNVWQRMAVKTYGVATPGNVVTLVGFALVIAGLNELLHHRYLSGMLLVAIGRLADVADGWAADQTGTKSPLGELLDAVLDKVGTFATLGVFAVAGIAPTVILIMLFLPHAFITIVTMVAAQRKKQLHPSRAGKLSMATAWVSLVAFLCVKLLPHFYPSVIEIIAIVIACVSVLLSIIAAREYMRYALGGASYAAK